MNTTPTPEALPEIFSIRIQRDYSNKDGWVARALSNSKIAFIKNIDALIAELTPGQIWEAHLVEEKPKFAIVTLEHLTRQ